MYKTKFKGIKRKKLFWNEMTTTAVYIHRVKKKKEEKKSEIHVSLSSFLTSKAEYH